MLGPLSAELFTSNFTKYPDVNAQRSFYVRLVERLEARPGVLSAAITNAVPLRTSQPFIAAFQIEGRAVDDPNTRPTLGRQRSDRRAHLARQPAVVGHRRRHRRRREAVRPRQTGSGVHGSSASASSSPACVHASARHGVRQRST